MRQTYGHSAVILSWWSLTRFMLLLDGGLQWACVLTLYLLNVLCEI